MPSYTSSPIATQTNNIKNEVSREEIQAAVAKAVELRALHAALLQGSGASNATNLKFPSSSSPVSLHSHQFSATFFRFHIFLLYAYIHKYSGLHGISSI
ncbi:hypothetical protein Leryth_021621 [Lithospermum erythrorhizon]|nr:hypothetical protein Leryth_021621 [Lithospermum erythrorhizon]